MGETQKHNEHADEIFLLHEFLEWLQFTRKINLVENRSIAPLFGYDRHTLDDNEIRPLASEFFGIDFAKYTRELNDAIRAHDESLTR